MNGDWKENLGVLPNSGYRQVRPGGVEDDGPNAASETPGPKGRQPPGIRRHRTVLSPWQPVGQHRENGGFTTRRDLASTDGKRLAVQLIPQQESRRIRLFAGGRFTPLTDDPLLVSIGPAGHHEYTLHGQRPGPALVHAVNGRGVCESEMRVFVLGRMIVPVAFRHYIYETDGRRIRDSAWREPAADRMIAGMNEIYIPQTNIRFERVSARWEARAAVDPGAAADFERPEVLEDAKRQQVEGAAFTLLLVQKLAHDRRGSHTGGAAILAAKGLVFLAYSGDDAKAAARAAHEIGHHLAWIRYRLTGGHNPDRRYLMYETESNGGYIDYDDARAMRQQIRRALHSMVSETYELDDHWWEPLSLDSLR